MTTTSTKRGLDAVLLQQIDAAYTFARWTLGHPAVAEDVIEDVIVGYPGTRAPNRDNRARAQVLREVRLAAQRQHGCGTAHTFTDLLNPAQVTSSIGARAAGIELERSAVQKLRCAVAALSLEQREVVLLRDTGEISYREIATLTGLPRSTIISRLWRARDALESCFTGCEAADRRASEGLSPMPLVHGETPAAIDAYIDAEVDIGTAATFVQHVARCRDCAQRLLSRSRLIQQVRSVTLCRAPETLRKRIEARLRF